MMSMCGFKSFIYVFTTTSLNYKCACFDLMFVKYNKFINTSVAKVIQTAITGHYLITLAIPLIKHNCLTPKYQLETSKNRVLINALKTEQRTGLFNSNNVNKCCDIFYE